MLWQLVEIIHRHLHESFTQANQLFIWDGEGENPYYAFLGLASLIVTTPDSISMTTEAIASTKPVCTISTERAKVSPSADCALHVYAWIEQ